VEDERIKGKGGIAPGQHRATFCLNRTW